MEATKRKLSFERKLLSYSAMASAVLAAVEVGAAECSGVLTGSKCYTDVPDQTLNSDGMIPIDFDGDGDHEFVLSFTRFSLSDSEWWYGDRYALLQPRAGSVDLGSAILGGFTSSTRGPASDRPGALIPGDEAGASGFGVWTSNGDLGQFHFSGSCFGSFYAQSGNLPDRGRRFLGVKVVLDGATIHYGWVRVTVQNFVGSVTLHDYAFEMTPGEPCSTDDVYHDGFESGDVSLWSASAGASVPFSSGLVSYWAFDDGVGNTTVSDSAGSNDGQLVNMNAGVAWIHPGKLGNFALSFDGFDDYVNFGNDASLDLEEAMTLSMWVRLTDRSGIRGLFSKTIDLANSSWQILACHDGNPFNGDAPRASLSLEDGGSGAYLLADLPDPIPLGYPWHHLAMTYDRSDGAFRIFYDGEQVRVLVDAAKRPIQVSTVDLVAGAKAELFSFFQGDLDDVGLWNRALSSSEIAQMWNGGAGTAIGDLIVE